MDARDRIHPLGDIIFNPTAGPGDPDWRVMYLSVGDAGNGEQSDAAIRRTPQQLSALGGKILRIVPDLAGGNTPSTVSPNGKYRIPDDNPFTGISNANVRDEIYALGLRNPHRMSWDVDPADPNNNHLIVSDIGLFSW
jgi:glucose/arabinose dehydrogenase